MVCQKLKMSQLFVRHLYFSIFFRSPNYFKKLRNERYRTRPESTKKTASNSQQSWRNVIFKKVAKKSVFLQKFVNPGRCNFKVASPRVNTPTRSNLRCFANGFQEFLVKISPRKIHIFHPGFVGRQGLVLKRSFLSFFKLDISLQGRKREASEATP